MRWPSADARELQPPTAGMITNINDHVREAEKSTAPATAAVFFLEIFFGIDAADQRQVVTRIVPSEGVKPAEGMTKATLLKRAAEYLKAGFRVHGVYEAGPTGFVLARELIALGATCLVVCAQKPGLEFDGFEGPLSGRQAFD